MRENYTISEISQMLKITTNKIRFYEKKGLLKPFREEENKYRKFNEDDIVRLQSILLYRSVGLSIEVIKNILINNEKENYLNHLNNQWKIVNDEIHKLSTIRNSLEEVIDKIYDETDNYKIKDDLLYIINESNKLNIIKDNWEDKWNFNNWAKSYDEYVKNNKGSLKIYKNYEIILKNVFEEVEKLNKKDGVILEIGIGTGNLASMFLYNNYNIIGIDQSREMLSVAKEKYPKLKVRLGEFLKIPYDNKSFDIIVSTYAFHHLNNEEKNIAIEEMVRVLKENGVIVIGDLMFESSRSKEEIIKNLTKDEIDEINDEYYSYIDVLTTQFQKHNKSLKYTRIDKLNYVITII